ncbi:MAG: carboxylating nicotinate-nucleotide diphosphorylase, partial [Candidatus Polarisedimenticolaceae bacterium]|nr:carboxylating nicotinate-nucleotide diphosphorylase [Candidatus Polarisedimenticolaceae bacterium]
IPGKAHSQVQVICREPAVMSGVAWFNETFRQLDPAIHIHWHVQDGDTVMGDMLVCQLEGNTRALLSGERSALNYLQTLSGTATLVQRYVEMVAGTGVKILDTRKTIPGLRYQQKYAVRCGGGFNHRIGLFDAVLIKENHIHAAGSIAQVMAAVRSQIAEGVEVEIEVESLDELEQALTAGAKRILIDNFAIDDLRKAVEINAGRARLEASGGISMTTIRAIAETGVDDISMGGLTKDLQSIDLSMRFV